MAVKTYKIYSLGCKVNQHDSHNLKNLLQTAGYQEASVGADLVIVNTCAVTKTAIRKGRQIITKSKKDNPLARLVVVGCWPRVYKETIDQSCVDLFWSTGDYVKLIKKINCWFIDIDKTKQNIVKRTILAGVINKPRYFIKIQDGCQQFCSYCIIPYARGKLSSRSEQEVINEVEQTVNQGVKEIVLCGIHLGLYGYPKKNSLTGLIIKLLCNEKLARLRLSSIEVNEISPRLIKIIAQEKRLCRHLHIPLQSGSDRILKLMNRPYNVKKYYAKIKTIRHLLPDIAISTDIIVGFPGETEADFQATMNLVKQIKFSRLHVFSFSSHESTPATYLPNKISPSIINKRSARLRQFGQQLKTSYDKKFIGKILPVLVENYQAGIFSGKTEYYFDVKFTQRDIANKIISRPNKIIKQIVNTKIKGSQLSE